MQDSEHEANSPVSAATREAMKKRQFHEDGAEQKEESGFKRKGAQFHPCHHDVAIPPNYETPTLDPEIYGTIHEPKYSGEMAKKYPFQLDNFQAFSVACIERNESVLVAAHTSAGKTAVAEYAIAKALKSNQRCVYTSPLKALSNQKYRELTEEFTDVGLMTGDVSINPNASCVVMTTEIFRSMMYHGSELLREISWVIFDEVHYMQDRERGVVWEEVIILMPKEIRMTFLSATLPNSLEFAEWVTSVHGSPCHVVSTDYRPTPLVHYAFPLGGKGLYLLMDHRGHFHSKNFQDLKANFQKKESEPAELQETEKSHRSDRDKKDRVKRNKTKRNKNINKVSLEKELDRLVRVIKNKKMDPVIIFSFSRRECEAYARTLAAAGKPDASGVSLDFNNQEEKEKAATIFDSALELLPEEDRDLPMVKMMRPVILRGIGIHHSGLLPILKELVEILFQDSLIKCLFATETFAMGLNMPAKTVIFTQLTKWDGEERRPITSAEYIQMSGRAGRRGQDDLGYALLLAEESLDEETCRTMMTGGASPLLSSFKLTYYTLLNLLRRVEGSGKDMEYVIARSFSQFQHEKKLPEMKERLCQVEKEIKRLSSVTEEDAREYMSLHKILLISRARILNKILEPDRCIHFLRAGRLVRVAHGNVPWGYGVVVSVQRISNESPPDSKDSYVVDTMLCCDAEETASGNPVPLPLTDPKASMCVVPVSLTLITGISSLRIAIPNDLTEEENRIKVLKTLQDAVKRYPNHILPELAPEDFGIQSDEVNQAIKMEDSAREKLEQLSQRISSTLHELTEGEKQAKVSDVKENGEEVKGEYINAILRKKARLLKEYDSLERNIRMNQLTEFQEEAKARTAVLRKLGHISDEGVVTMKGRAACEVDTGDELLASEMMFNGTFNSLNASQLASLVSCLVPIEEARGEIKVQAALSEPLRQLQETARMIAEVGLECKLDVDIDTYVESFRPTLMEVVYQWTLGKTFKEVMDLTDVFEGSVIRAMRRLDELMQNLQRAAEAVGDSKLAVLFEESRGTLKRDLPFAASLYVDT